MLLCIAQVGLTGPCLGVWLYFAHFPYTVRCRLNTPSGLEGPKIGSVVNRYNISIFIMPMEVSLHVTTLVLAIYG